MATHTSWCPSTASTAETPGPRLLRRQTTRQLSPEGLRIRRPVDADSEFAAEPDGEQPSDRESKSTPLRQPPSPPDERHLARDPSVSKIRRLMGDVDAEARKKEAYSILDSPQPSPTTAATPAGAPPKLARFYSDNSVLKRYQLIEHPLVREALDALWVAACAPYDEAEADGAARVPCASWRLAKEEYLVMHRKIVLALAPSTTPAEAMKAAEDDWLRDAEGCADYEEHRAGCLASGEECGAEGGRQPSSRNRGPGPADVVRSVDDRAVEHHHQRDARADRDEGERQDRRDASQGGAVARRRLDVRGGQHVVFRIGRSGRG